MAQTEINIDDALMAFLESYKALGFTDRSEVVTIALERLKDEMVLSESPASPDITAEKKTTEFI